VARITPGKTDQAESLRNATIALALLLAEYYWPIATWTTFTATSATAATR
jgi:hypothetical protein